MFEPLNTTTLSGLRDQTNDSTFGYVALRRNVIGDADDRRNRTIDPCDATQCAPDVRLPHLRSGRHDERRYVLVSSAISVAESIQ